MAVFRHGGLRLYLLKLLDEQPRHGYDVISLLEDRFFGLYAPSAGTVYPRLARLEADGLVQHEEGDGRKVYRLTDAGREELARSATELRDLEEELSRSVRSLAREVRTEVHESVRGLRDELKQAAREVRRESRAQGRATSGAPGRGAGPLGGLAKDLAMLGRDLFAAAHDAEAARIEAARAVLTRARAEALSALAEPASGGGDAPPA
jgi:DNA-binding PadR family transcriptional regulator